MFTGIGLLENGSRKKHTLEHDRFKAVETHDMNQDHEFGHKVSHVYIVMVYHFERFQLWIFKGCVFFFVGRMVRITHSHSRGYLKKWWIPKSPWLFFILCHGRLCWMMNWGCPNDLGNPWNPPFGQCSGRSLAMLKAEAKTRRECDAATRSGDMSNQNWIWI